MIAVRPSRIHGLGLFASATIPRGTLIGTLEGRFVEDDGPHVLWLDDEQGFEVRNELKYINHDATPNAAYFDDLTVVAIRDIAAGDEITHDYEGTTEIDLEGDEIDENDADPDRVASIERKPAPAVIAAC